jgi:hypothetical protein
MIKMISKWLEPIRCALLGDVPAVLDSIWRRVEFYFYRPGRFIFDKGTPLSESPQYKRYDPAYSVLFALYALLTVFVIVGPTIDTFCGLGGRSGLRAIKIGTSAIAVLAALFIGLRLIPAMGGRLGWRLGVMPAAHGIRRVAASAALGFIAILAAAPPFVLVIGLFDKSSVTNQCVDTTGLVPSSLFQLVLIIVIPLIAWLVLRHFRGLAFRAEKSVTPGENGGRWTFLWLTGLWLAGVASLLPWATAENAKEAVPGPYLQSTWIVLGVLVLIAFLGRPFAWRRLQALPARTDDSFKAALGTKLLLNVLEDSSAPSENQFTAALLTGIGTRPLQVLLLPACFAITVPHAWLLEFVGPAFFFSGMMSTYAAMRDRWQQVLRGVERWFFVGLPLPVSVLVIVLGFLRIFNESYVSTVLEAAPIGTIFTGIVIAYLSAWFFEVWINRWMAEAVLKYLGAKSEAIGSGVYTVLGNTTQNGTWSVGPDRVFYIHGPGRIGVQGWQGCSSANNSFKHEERFANYTFLELFRQLAGDGEEDRKFIDELQRQLRVYYYSLNACVAIAIAGLIFAHNWMSAPERAVPAIRASAPTHDGVDLAAKLTGTSEPAIIVAASGGGTRAALYTAYALGGLESLGQAHNIVLISGASGGGAAAAAFVERFHTLTTTAPSADPANPWSDYRHGVTEPFIEDVLDGMNELRISTGVPMGQLLIESMERRLYDHGTFGNPNAQAGAPKDRPALILNSTISGHPAHDSAMLGGRAAWDDGHQGCQSNLTPFGWLSGARLVYTDLGEGNFAQFDDEHAPDVRLPFEVINDPRVELAQAAALNANFPPVFPNAKITIERGPDATAPIEGCPATESAYFVTDGGATENLGLMSALVALRNTLRSLNDTQWQTLRPLHVIAIEASAVDYEYQEDRGVGAATGGSKERLAGAVTQLLVEAIDQQLTTHGKQPLAVHFLPLPLAFRSRGGFGTHWMYAQSFTVANSLRVTIPAWYEFWKRCGPDCKVTLDQAEVESLWAGLFRPEGDFCMAGISGANQDTLTVQRWICGGRLVSDPSTGPSGKPDWQVEEWKKTIASLGDGRGNAGN